MLTAAGSAATRVGALRCAVGGDLSEGANRVCAGGRSGLWFAALRLLTSAPVRDILKVATLKDASRLARARGGDPDGKGPPRWIHYSAGPPAVKEGAGVLLPDSLLQLIHSTKEEQAWIRRPASLWVKM
jgi:hypothetical protein